MNFSLLECGDLFPMFNLKKKNNRKCGVFNHFCPTSAAITVKFGKNSILALCPQQLLRAKYSCQKNTKVLQACGEKWGGYFEKGEHLKVALHATWLDKTTYTMA